MDRHNVQILAAAVFFFTMLSLSGSHAQAQGTTLEQSFAQAVRVEGLDYISARNAIVEKKGDAIPFLKSKLADSDWHVRVLAEAILGRVENPEQYVTYDYSTVGVMAWKGRHVVTFYSLLATVKPGFRYESGMSPTWLDRRGRKRNLGIDDVAFFAELALKGSIPKKPTVHYELPPEDPEAKYTFAEIAEILNVDEKLAKRWMGDAAYRDYRGGPLLVKQNSLRDFVKAFLVPDPSLSAIDPRFRESARCWAMLWLGDCFNDDPVTIPLLIELLRSDESTMIRGYAALALGMTGKQQAIDPLTKARSDADEQVKDAAQRSLAMLHRIMEAESNVERK